MDDYPIGIIPYINMEPYRQLGAPEYCRFLPLFPKESVKAIQQGRVLAAAIPVGGLSFLDKLVEPVGNFGIAARKCSMSVLFFSKIPFNSFNKKHNIQLTSESTSSVKLLYLLLGYKIGFENMPRLSSFGLVPDGELIIGDKALLNNSSIGTESLSSWTLSNPYWPYVTDLAKLWYEIKGCPFVFARWVIRKDSPKIVRVSVDKWLSDFKKFECKLVDEAVKVSAKVLKIPDCYVRAYFQVIKRTLDAEDLFGQKLFIDSFKKHGKRPLFQSRT